MRAASPHAFLLSFFFISAAGIAFQAGASIRAPPLVVVFGLPGFAQPHECMAAAPAPRTAATLYAADFGH